MHTSTNDDIKMLCGTLSVAQTFPKRKRLIWLFDARKKKKGAADAAPFGV